MGIERKEFNLLNKNLLQKKMIFRSNYEKAMHKQGYRLFDR